MELEREAEVLESEQSEGPCPVMLCQYEIAMKEGGSAYLTLPGVLTQVESAEFMFRVLQILKDHKGFRKISDSRCFDNPKK